LRLLHKLPVLYGSRFFDILLLDALYAHAPVLQLADRIGWDLVISLKQNQRELYQSAVRLFARRPADSSGTERHDGKQYQFQIWDSAGFPFSADHPQPVRVVRSEEKLTQNHYRRGKLHPKPPSTNGSGLGPWMPRPFPPRWCAASAMTAGNWRTMAVMI
jgi:hypothetical protein